MRLSPTRIIALVAALSAIMAGAICWHRVSLPKTPPAPDYLRAAAGLSALESYEQQAAWFHRGKLGRNCDGRNRLNLLVTAAFEPPHHVEVEGDRIVRTDWQPRPNGSHKKRYADFIERQVPIALSPGATADLWHRVDDALMALSSVDPDEPDPVDGWFASIEICKAGKYAFFHRSTPDRSPQDLPLLDLIKHLDALTAPPFRRD